MADPLLSHDTHDTDVTGSGATLNDNTFGIIGQPDLSNKSQLQ